MRLPPFARRLGSAALVLTVGVGVSACGDDSAVEPDATSSTSGESEDTAEDSAQDTAEAGRDATDGGGEEQVAELSADDFYREVMTALREAETFAFTTVSSSSGRSQTLTGEARFVGGGMDMSASSEGAQAMEMILLDQTMYLKSAGLGAGDTWVKIDLSDPTSLYGMLGNAADPEVTFKALESPKELELLGSEDVDGVATNHYRITLDPAQFMKAMRFPASMAGMLPDELVTEMWVDADNLPRKFTQTMEAPGVGGAEATSSTEGTYSDFGTEVEIKAPPASEVTERPGM